MILNLIVINSRVRRSSTSEYLPKQHAIRPLNDNTEGITKCDQPNVNIISSDLLSIIRVELTELEYIVF